MKTYLKMILVLVLFGITIHGQNETSLPINGYKDLQTKHILQTEGTTNNFMQNTDISDTTLRLVGQWGYGKSHAIANDGQYIYTSSGAVFQVLDVSGDTSVIILSELPLEDVITTIEIEGTNAFIGTEYYGLFIVDISDPANPVKIGQCQLLNKVFGIAVEDQYAYVVIGLEGIKVFDITDRENPEIISEYKYPNICFFRDVVVSEGYAFVTGSSDLLILDIKEPANITFEKEVYVWGGGDKLDIVGSTLYVLGTRGRLEIFSIADPLNPINVANHEIKYECIDIYANFMYVSTHDVLHIYNIADPDSIVLTGSFVHNYVISEDINYLNDRVYITANYKGLGIIDVTAKTEPEEVSLVDNVILMDNGIVSDTYAYLFSKSRFRKGLITLDVSATPKKLSIEPLSTGLIDALFVDEYIIGLTNSDGILVIDATDPEYPILKEHISDDIRRTDIKKFSDNYLLVCSDYGIEQYDCSDPLNIKKIQTIDVEGVPLALDMLDSLVYVNVYAKGIKVYNFNNPNTPEHLSTFDELSNLRNIIVSGDYAISFHYNTLYITDISDPQNIQLISTYEHKNENAIDIALEHSTAYILYETGVLDIVDLNNICKPELIGNRHISGFQMHCTLNDNNLFVVSDDGGLWIFEPNFSMEKSLILTNPTARDTFMTGMENEIRWQNQFVEKLKIEYRKKNEENWNLIAENIDARKGSYVWYPPDSVNGKVVLKITDMEDSGVSVVTEEFLLKVPVYRLVTDYSRAKEYVIGMQVENDFAYLTISEAQFGLEIVDVSDPSHPRFASFYQTPFGYVAYSYVHDNLAFITHESGIYIVDVSDPNNPKELGLYADENSYIRARDVKDTYLFASSPYGDIHVIDISDPENPILAKSYTEFEKVYSVDIQGEYAFWGDSRGGLRVMDVSDPMNISEITCVDTSFHVRRFDISNGILYAASGKNMHLYDVRNMINPIKIGEYTAIDQIKDLSAAGNQIYLLENDHIRVLRKEETNTFVDLGSYYTPNYRPPNIAKAVQCYNEDVYIAYHNHGFLIWDNPSVYTDVNENSESVPSSYTLYQNYPNPFNPVTRIRFSLREAGFVNVSIYNILGERVATLVDEYRGTGDHEVLWNATEQPSGIYFYELRCNDFRSVKKMLLLR